MRTRARSTTTSRGWPLVRWAMAGILLLFVSWLAIAANVVTDGDMELAGTANWPHTDITDTNSSAKAADQSASGQSLKGTSQTGQRVDVGWYNAQTVGTVNATDTVLLSLWWGIRYNVSTQSAQGNLSFDIKPASGAWTNVWTQTINTPSTTFQSGTVTSLDISTSFTTTESYDIRVRFEGRTGRDAAAFVEVWWDDVVLDVTGAGATTTVNDGTNPGNATICPAPGGGATEVDGFTLETSSGTDTVTDVQVTLTEGAPGIALVEITSDNGATVYGSVANPAGNVVDINLITNINVTTTPVQYKVRITPKTHANMPAPASGAVYNVQGTVSDITITSGNTKSLNDTASATVTIDNLSDPVTGVSGTPGDSQVQLNWTNPGANFDQVLILRNTASITDAPQEGNTSYIVGNTIGTSTVVYIGGAQTFTDTTVSNGTSYWYKIFARDLCANYDVGVQTGPHTPAGAGPTTTVNDGTNPGGASLCPGGVATELDAFTLETSTGTDTVTDAQVTLTEGAPGIALVEITSDNGATVYGSVANPAGNVVDINLGTTINVTTTPVQYKVRITPKTHANMPAPASGAVYNVQGTVSDITITSGNTKSLNDTASATVTIDNSVNNVTGISGTPGDSQVALSWTNPVDTDFDQVVILRNTASISDAPQEGNTSYIVGNTIPPGNSEIVYIGSAQNFTDTTVSNGTSYWYKIFARDNCANYATGVETGPHSPAAATPDGTTGGNSTASASSCSQITVTSLFTGDGNGNGSTTTVYDTNVAFPSPITACNAVSGPSPRQCIIPGLSGNTTYFVRVTFNDVDGVTGTNNQVLTEATPACNATDNAAPMILVLAPERDGVLGGVAKVKLQIYDANSLAATNPVQWSVDGDPLTTSTVTQNTNYNCDNPGQTDKCRVYEITLDTTSGGLNLTNGPHQLNLQVTDAGSPTANVATLTWPFQVSNASGGRPRGDARLLRRTPGPQLCIDCHNLPTHSSQLTGSQFGNWAVGCSDCHTPHRTRNIFLIREQLVTPNSGTYTVQFHVDEGPSGGNPGTGPGQFSFLGDRTGASNAPYNDGICEVCHTKTAQWRNNSTADKAHNQDKRCLDCHAHEEGFKGVGSCLDCHNEAQGPTVAATGQKLRRIVTDDFDDAQRNSHHVGNGSTFMGGTLTEFDCVVCHAEGNAVDIGGGQFEIQLTTWHNDGLGVGGANRIDLKDVDNPATVYSYDKDNLFDGAGGPGATLADWGSANAQWRTETSNNLDPFCLSCHDDDGATSTKNVVDSECAGPSGDPLNPFCDGFISNNYDQQDRTRVVDVRSRVDPAENPGGAADLDQVGEARGPDGIVDPPEGVYSRHAIRGYADSVYTKYDYVPNDATFSTIWEANRFVNLGVSDAKGPLWNDTSVMGCADCHTVDGANAPNRLSGATTVGNAHGSESEYLLKDANGEATEGTLGALTYVCYRCHAPTTYNTSNHTGNASDWQDKTTFTGIDRRDDGKGSSFFAIACMNCHAGGAPWGSGKAPWGYIHGITETFLVGQDGGGNPDTGNTQRLSYRFVAGAGQRWYDPEGWTGTRSTCFTLASPDEWGACKQHNRGQDYTTAQGRTLRRDIKY